VYTIPEPIVALGRREYQRLLVRVAECTATGEWPGVAADVQELALPEWAHFDPGEDLELTMGGDKLEVF
jgi:hypothetical protein